MTLDEQESPAPQQTGIGAFHDRNLMVGRVKAALAGSGARARERDTALVISDPRQPGSRVHVRYADGSVSVQRTSWDFLGYLQDYKDHDHPDDEPVSVALILSRLKDPDASRHP